MSKSKPERWKLSSRNMEDLLQDVANYKGESLWQDAWRRLRRNRAAFLSMLFLVAFGLLSLLAPLLPLASPKSLSLRTEAAPPSWPWDDPVKVTAETPGGFALTKTFGAVFDNGWRHRTVIEFTGLDNVNDDGFGQLKELVEGVTDRTAVLDRRTSDTKGTALFAAIPLEFDDQPRIDWAETGLRGKATVAVAGTELAWLTLDIPVDETVYVVWRVDANGRDIAVVLEDETAAQVRYTMRLKHELQVPLLGLTLNGRDLPISGRAASRNAPDAIANAPLAKPEIGLSAMFNDIATQLMSAAAVDGDVVVEQVSKGRETTLFRRQEVRATEQAGVLHDDLMGRLTVALAASPLGEQGVTIEEVTFENGYWDLGWMDRQLVSVRASLFGLWQTGNWMGTDSKGRDIMSRIIWGSRTSIIVALIATLCSLLIGVTYGSFSGLMGGRIDNLMMRIVDILYSLPFIFVVIFLITIINTYRAELDGYGIDREVTFYLVIGAIYWLTMARVVRGQVLSLKNAEFIEAARVIGASTPRILFTHIVPNVLSIVIVYLTLTIPAVMLFEAFLSFLGLGIEPPKVSWGILAVDGTEAINPIRIYWWLVLFPALAMGSTLLALNVLGDGLRDALDPKMRGKD